MLDAAHFTPNPLGVGGRRAHARQYLAPLTYLNLDDLTEGAVLNINEHGVALSAAAVLPENPLVHLRIYFKGSTDWIEARGYIRWTSTSKKEGGVRFLELSEGARQRIRSWFAEEPPANQHPPGSEASRSEQPSPDTAADRSSMNPSPECTTQVAGGDSTILPPDDCKKPTFDREGGSEMIAFRVLSGDVSASANGPRESFPGAERRARTRTRIVPLGYIQLGDANGGIALNISEAGMAITAAMILADDYVPSVKVQFPDSSDWIETSGRIAWRSESRKEAGVHFVGLSEKARLQIRNWIASQPLATTTYAPQNPDHETQQAALKNLQGYPEVNPAPSSFIPDKSAGEQEDLSVPAPPSPAETLVPSPESDVRTEKPAQERIAVQIQPEKRLPGQTRSELQHRRWAAFAILAALVGLTSLALRGHTLLSSWQTRVLAEVREKGRDLSQTFKNTTRFTEGQTSTAPTRDAKTTVPPVPKSESDVDNRADTHDSSSRQLTTQFVPARVTPAAPIVKTPFREAPIHVVRETRRGSRTPGQAKAEAGTMNDGADAKVPVRLADSLVGSQTELDAKIAALVNSTPHHPAVPFLADGKSEKTSGEQSKSSATLQQTSFKDVGSVSISMNPYPAIRVAPETSRKKSHSGASLQLGHLILRVDPIYPDDAKQQRIEGTVTVHAIIDRNGVVENVTSVNGPPPLAKVVLTAIRQWRYTQTLVAGRPVETEEDIAVTFRFSNPAKE